jgi:sulfotransferase family protein
MGVLKRVGQNTGKPTWLARVYPGSWGNAAHLERDRSFLPAFFIIGPPRTGTSWLYEVLREYSSLPYPTKETRFFDLHFHRGMDWYRAHFSKVPDGQPVGEIAPTYFASPEARQRIAETVPHARVVCIFRNPVERVLSLYRVKRAYGMIPWTFEQAILQDPELMETSRYAANLKAWRSMLGPNQVLATVYDDLRDNPQGYLDKLVDFIGAPRFRLRASQSRSVHASESLTHPRSYTRTRNATKIADWFKARRFDRLVAAVRNSPLRSLVLGGGPRFGELPPGVAVRLYDLFRSEVEELEALLSRDFSAWKYGGAQPLCHTARQNSVL